MASGEPKAALQFLSSPPSSISCADGRKLYGRFADPACCPTFTRLRTSAASAAWSTIEGRVGALGRCQRPGRVLQGGIPAMNQRSGDGQIAGREGD
jgi:hypothetical protein